MSEEPKLTDDGIKRAKKFLKAVREALKHAKAIHATVSVYPEVEGKPYRDSPPLLKESAGWEVDPEEFEAFEYLVHFMSEAIFGVDCDSDSAVRMAFVNMQQHENFLPPCRVERIDWDERGDLLRRQRQIELVKIIINSARSRLEGMERCYEDDLKKFLRYHQRLKLAKGCATCDGKGWVDTDWETWNALDYQEKCRTEDIGCDRNLKEPPTNRYSRAKLRLFCECQKEPQRE